MARIELFVIGASAGGLEALQRIVANLPRAFPSAICVVMHVSPESPGLIPEILSETGELPAQHARDGDALTPGCIFVARADHHLLVNSDGRLQLGHGPKENRFRPAIDPLFRTASLRLDGRVGGIILSGGLDDGIAGLVTIKRRGIDGGNDDAFREFWNEDGAGKLTTPKREESCRNALVRMLRPRLTPLGLMWNRKARCRTKSASTSPFWPRRSRP